jgi:hypothetical protein
MATGRDEIMGHEATDAQGGPAAAGGDDGGAGRSRPVLTLLRPAHDKRFRDHMGRYGLWEDRAKLHDCAATESMLDAAIAGGTDIAAERDALAALAREQGAVIAGQRATIDRQWAELAEGRATIAALRAHIGGTVARAGPAMPRRARAALLALWWALVGATRDDRMAALALALCGAIFVATMLLAR